MNNSDIRLEMELSGVRAEDIEDLMKIYESKALTLAMLDEELFSRGYDKIFDHDFSHYDEYDDWEDEEFSSVEKFPYKQNYK